MKVPIPQDWNGESWTCVQVQWPNSPEWVAILTGFISVPGSGRFWDGKTGIITDTQSIGEEIWDKNWPFVSCGDVDPTPPDQNTIHCLIGSAETGINEDTAMSLCGYNPNAFKIEDGVLWVRDFCGEWVAIGALASPNEDPPPNIWDDVDPTPDFYACGKVEYIIDQFILLSNAAWDNWTNPFTIEGAMRNAVTSAVNLERAHCYEWMALLATVSLVAQKSDFNDATAVQNAKCVALGTVAATGVGTDGEVDAVVGALAAAFNNEIGAISELPWAVYWGFVRDTFGRKDCRLLLSLGATNGAADCECVDPDPYTGSVTWADTRTIQLESQGATLAEAELMEPNIMRFVVQGANNENFQEVVWQDDMLATGTIQEMEVEMQLQSADVAGYYPAVNWDDTNPTPIALYFQPETGGPAADHEDWYPAPNKQVVILKWDAPADLNGAYFKLGQKINPLDQTPDAQAYRFTARITYSGALR